MVALVTRPRAVARHISVVSGRAAVAPACPPTALVVPVTTGGSAGSLGGSLGGSPAGRRRPRGGGGRPGGGGGGGWRQPTAAHRAGL